MVSASDFQARGQGFESRWRRPDQKGIFLLELTFVLTLHPIVLRMRLKATAGLYKARRSLVFEVSGFRSHSELFSSSVSGLSIDF